MANKSFILFKQKGKLLIVFWVCYCCVLRGKALPEKNLKAERGLSEARHEVHFPLQLMVIATEFGKVSVLTEFPFKT